MHDAAAQRFLDRAGLALTSDDKNIQLRCQLAKRGDQIESGGARQVDVEKHQVGLQLTDCGQCGLGRMGNATHFETVYP